MLSEQKEEFCTHPGRRVSTGFLLGALRVPVSWAKEKGHLRRTERKAWGC